MDNKPAFAGFKQEEDKIEMCFFMDLVFFGNGNPFAVMRGDFFLCGMRPDMR